jgi:hypothetical protein
MYKIMITGSRDWVWYHDVEREIMERAQHWHPEDVEIHHGAAAGADSMADAVAKKFWIPTVVYPPDYGSFGTRAPHIRNQAMVDAKPDIVLAFVRSMSSGTVSTMVKALKAGIKVFPVYKDV